MCICICVPFYFLVDVSKAPPQGSGKCRGRQPADNHDGRPASRMDHSQLAADLKIIRWEKDNLGQHVYCGEFLEG